MTKLPMTPATISHMIINISMGLGQLMIGLAKVAVWVCSMTSVMVSIAVVPPDHG